MKNRYESLLILNVKGNEESAKEIVEKLEGDFKTEGAEVEQVQKIGNRHFSYIAGAAESGFYVNIVFHGEPTVIEKLRSRFRLNHDIYRQQYHRLPVPKARKVKRSKVAKAPKA
jgi:ribosomal protein S6